MCVWGDINTLRFNTGLLNSAAYPVAAEPPVLRLKSRQAERGGVLETHTGELLTLIEFAQECFAPTTPATTRSTSRGDVIYGPGLQSNESVLTPLICCRGIQWREPEGHVVVCLTWLSPKEPKLEISPEDS